ncbi:MAG: hypothetical protein Kow0019_12760 [Methanobacteriaceae archaeon]
MEKLVTDKSQIKITEACEAMKKEDEPKPRNLEIQYIDKDGILKYGYLIFT